jgi:hypothetical protein
MSLTPFAYKMHVKLREEGIWCPSLPTPCEEICLPTGVDIRKCPQLERETCLLSIDRDKDHLLSEP